MSFCDIVATASFIFHEHGLIPYRIVFTSVRNPNQQFIVEPTRKSLKFSFDDVQRNTKHMGNPVVDMPESPFQPLRTHADNLTHYLGGEFYSRYLKNSWNNDIIGCLDGMTFHYLLDLLPDVVLLESNLMDGRLDLMTVGKDPVDVGKVAANRLQTARRFSREDFWDL